MGDPLSSCYRFLHQEECRLDVDPWQPFTASTASGKDAFEGDAAVPWRIVRAASEHDWAELGLLPPAIVR